MTVADNAFRDAIVKAIRRIPKGKVASYGRIATAAGYPGYHRQVVQILKSAEVSLPWHRVLGADGRIKLPPDRALDQRFRLEMEGVVFRGDRVSLKTYGLNFT